MIRPPRLPDRFEWLRLLGQGAMGSVHAVHDHQTQRLVALKLVPLPASGGGDEAVREEQLRLLGGEASAAQRLSHPHIAQVWESGLHGDVFWIAMEPVPGVPLARYTLPSRLLPPAVVARLGAQLAEALAHAHAAGVLHRDLKPANAMVQWPAGHARLIDFGLARHSERAATRSGLFLGSPAYMAPELAEGRPPSAASDVYALGATLFELLSGRHPHPATTVGEWLRLVGSAAAPRLDLLAPKVPTALADLVTRTLAREPAHRPAHAGMLAHELRQVAFEPELAPL